MQILQHDPALRKVKDCRYCSVCLMLSPSQSQVHPQEEAAQYRGRPDSPLLSMLSLYNVSCLTQPECFGWRGCALQQACHSVALCAGMVDLEEVFGVVRRVWILTTGRGSLWLGLNSVIQRCRWKSFCSSVDPDFSCMEM